MFSTHERQIQRLSCCVLNNSRVRVIGEEAESFATLEFAC